MAKQKQSSNITELFFDRLAELLGQALFSDIKKTFVERPTTFRVNTIKTSKHLNIKTYLEEKGFKLKQVSWYKDVFILQNKSKRELMETEAYLQGKIYMQSLASMVPPLVLDAKPGEKVLDLTAAPGSKTSQIAALMNREGELVANDMDKVRFFKLQHNMELLGVMEQIPREKEGYEVLPSLRPPPRLPLRGGGSDIEKDHFFHTTEVNENFAEQNFHSTKKSPSPRRGGRGRGLGEGRIDAIESPWTFVLKMQPGWKLCSEYPEGYFDKILLDAPCSAEARFIMGDPKTYGYWSERKIKEMVSNQWRLLLSAWYALKPGGTLVYSTCTFAPEENEYQVSKFIEKVGNASVVDIDIQELKRLPIVKEWKGKPVNPETKKCLRVYPTKEIEGFFVAKILKKVV